MQGGACQPLVFGLGEWGARWQFGEPRDDELDPELLLWWAHDRLDHSVPPGRRIVLEFAFTEERRRFWIGRTRLARRCAAMTGFDVDAPIRADLATLYRVWLGRLDLRAAI